jgi:hypothetical protein
VGYFFEHLIKSVFLPPCDPPLADNDIVARIGQRRASLLPFSFGFPSGIMHQNWNDTENISMAPAHGFQRQGFCLGKNIFKA